MNHFFRPRARVAQTFALVGALFLFSFHTGSAQDYGAVKKRLANAVEAGEITEEQADVMLEALVKFAGGKDLDLEELGAQLKAAVRAGKLTDDEAMAKWEAALKGATKKGATKKGATKKGATKKSATKKSDAGKGASKGKQASGGAAPLLPLDPDAIEEEQPVAGLTTPAAAANREGSSRALIFGWAANATHRFMDATHRGEARVIHGVSFRLDQREHDALGRTWSNVSLRVGHGDWSSIAYNDSEEFTLVDRPVKVFDQEWSFPAVKGRPPLTPASWGGVQNSLTFRFSEPFHYNGEDSIFLEFVFSGGTAHDGRRWEGQTPRGFEYFLDSMPERGGWRQTKGGAVTSLGVLATGQIVPAATSYAAGSDPTDMSVWTAAPKGMPFLHYITN